MGLARDPLITHFYHFYHRLSLIFRFQAHLSQDVIDNHHAGRLLEAGPVFKVKKEDLGQPDEALGDARGFFHTAGQEGPISWRYRVPNAVPAGLKKGAEGCTVVVQGQCEGQTRVHGLLFTSCERTLSTYAWKISTPSTTKTVMAAMTMRWRNGARGTLCT